MPMQPSLAAPIAPASPRIDARPPRAISPRRALLASVGVASLAALAALAFALAPTPREPAAARPAAPLRALHAAPAPLAVERVYDAAVATAPDAATAPDDVPRDGAATDDGDAAASLRAHHRRHTHGAEATPRAPGDAPHIYY